MYLFLLVLFGINMTSTQAFAGVSLPDVTKAPVCRQCGMDREKFAHSRMLIEYEDGTSVGTCSLHCAAVELANTIDRIPVMVSVGDYDSKELIDADKAVWVMGGDKKGVMTALAKWAFASARRLSVLSRQAAARLSVLMKRSRRPMTTCIRTPK